MPTTVQKGPGVEAHVGVMLDEGGSAEKMKSSCYIEIRKTNDMATIDRKFSIEMNGVLEKDVLEKADEE